MRGPRPGDVEELETTVGRDAAAAEAQCIIQPYRDIEECNFDTCSEPDGVREPSNATWRYQHGDVSPWASNRRHTAMGRRCKSYPKSSELPTDTVLGSMRSKILKWISTIPYTNHHKWISEGRLEGTGEWPFKKNAYCSWRSSSVSKLLLLRGIRKSSFVATSSRLTSWSSWSRQNIHCIKSYRFFPIGSDTGEVGILLL